MGQILVSLIPVVGQVAAARDASAFIYRLTRPGPQTTAEQVENWIGLVLSLLALVPEAGGAVAGVLRLARRGGRSVEVPLEAVLGVLNRMGRGAPLRWAREHLTYHAVLSAVRVQFRRVVQLLDDICAEILRHDRLLPQEALAAAGRVRADLRLLERRAYPGLAGAVRELVTPVEKAVRRAELTYLQNAAHGTTNGQVKAPAPAADPPTARAVADETFAAAAEAARVSGILRSARRGKGNFGLGEATAGEAQRAG